MTNLAAAGMKPAAVTVFYRKNRDFWPISTPGRAKMPILPRNAAFVEKLFQE